MGMIVSPFSFIALNEAEVTHGRTVQLSLNNLPPAIKQIVKDKAKENGLSEKEFEGRMRAEQDFAKENIPTPWQRDGVDITDMAISIHGNDAIDGHIMHELEFYDKSIDEAILESEDIVKAYNATIDAKFEEALKLVQKGEELEGKYGDINSSDINSRKDLRSYVGSVVHRGYTLPVTVLKSLIDDIGEMKEMFGVTDADVKKMVCEAAYQPSDDPEEIKKIVNARIKYNNTIIAFFKSMLQINYNALGLTKDEALALSGKLSSHSQHQSHKAIKDVKSIIVKNADKYKIGKASYDFRPLGMGCMFMTDEDVGPITEKVALDRMIQMLTQYDAIVVGHGGSDSEEYTRMVSKTVKEYKEIERRNRAEEDKEREEINTEIEKFTEMEVSKTPEGKKILELMKDAKKKSDTGWYDSDAYNQYIKMKYEILDDRDRSWDEREKELEELRNEANKLRDEHRKLQRAYHDEYRKLQYEYIEKYQRPTKNKIYRGETDDEHVNEVGKKCQEIMHKYADKIHNEQMQAMKTATRTYKKLHARNAVHWIIQPIHTLKAGPFTDVNDLVRQLIKEGFKNINLVSCNPGRHTLAKDILDTPDVKIHHANTSLLAESATYYDSGDIMVEAAFSEIDKSLMNTQKHLLSICETSGICYNDDEFLDECAAFFESGEAHEVLVEGVLATAWAKLKALITKALGFIINIFKKLIDLVAGLIRKIKDFFKKIFGSDRVANKFVKPITSGAILVENARINRSKVSSWEDMQKNVVSACEKIMKNIEETERKQTQNMQELEKYADKQSKTVNESSDPKMDNLLALLL